LESYVFIILFFRSVSFNIVRKLLALEFAEQMDSLLPADVMAKGPVSINSSCVQRFTARLTKPVGEAPSEQATFRAIADVRRKDEPPISDFVLLCAQLQQSAVRRLEFEGLLSDAKEDLRIASPFCAALKQLPPSASLLEHHRVISIASRPRMGAPTKAERAAATGSGSLQIATNYESGMHTGAYINKHVAFDNRRFGVAATRTQEDVHQALGLTTSNTRCPCRIRTVGVYFYRFRCVFKMICRLRKEGLRVVCACSPHEKERKELAP
jgi:hypothetical protein